MSDTIGPLRHTPSVLNNGQISISASSLVHDEAIGLAIGQYDSYMNIIDPHRPQLLSPRQGSRPREALSRHAELHLLTLMWPYTTYKVWFRVQTKPPYTLYKLLPGDVTIFRFL